MTPLVTPALFAVGAAAVVLAGHRRLRPQWAVWALTVTAVAVVGAVVAAALVAGIALVAGPHSAAWCSALLGHTVPRAPAVGLVLFVGALLTAWRAASFSRRRWAVLRRPSIGSGKVVLVEGPDPIAYADPSGGGLVVVSRQLWGGLDAMERLALVSHELGHLEACHHRFLAVTDALAHACPLVRPLTRSARFAMERAADEAAARAVGDRAVVARTILRAALAGAPAALAGIGSRGLVRARVHCLQHPAGPASTAERSIVVGALGVVLGAALNQLHHLAELLRHVAVA